MERSISERCESGVYIMGTCLVPAESLLTSFFFQKGPLNIGIIHRPIIHRLTKPSIGRIGPSQSIVLPLGGQIIGECARCGQREDAVPWGQHRVGMICVIWHGGAIGNSGVGGW